MSDLVLSKLKNDGNITKGQPGQWETKGNTAFRGVADSLAYEAPGQIKSVSSVPTMWARPLVTEMALYDTNHPIHKQMVSQWRGMLAAIALAEVEGFNLKVQVLDLDKEKYVDFGNALYELMPEPTNVLYTRENKNPWSEIYIFLWNGKPVGMSSPSTLVCPSEEGRWDGLRWWNQKDNLILSPEEHLNQASKQLLWRWLENIQANLIGYGGQKNPVNKIINLLNEFRAALKVNPNNVAPLTLSQNPTFFGEPINRGALELLNYPVQAPPKPSNLRIIPSAEKAKVKPLIIIDDKVADHWGERKQDIWVHKDRTLASLNVEDLKNALIVWDDVECITTEELFLPELTFLDLEDALPGGILPKSKGPLTFNGEKITPLIPLNPILLNYFTSEDLISKIELEPFNNVNGQGIRLIFNLPLSGMDETKPFQIYRLQKEYILKEENGVKYLPVLTVWPNFRAKGWQEYYTFYYDGDYGDDTFRVYFPNEQPKSFKAPDGTGLYQLSNLNAMPSCAICKDSYHQDIGLILLATPPEINSKGTWRVGVDFGTSFSHVYVTSENSGESPLNINQDLQLNITESSFATKFVALLENFIPEKFLPEKEPLPLSTVLTLKNGGDDDNELLPIFDGRIYVPDPQDFDPSKAWIKPDLKWSNIRFSKVFLRNLALLISASAVKEGMNRIEWCISYPTAFSYTQKTTFHRNWEEIAEELAPKTGMSFSAPNLNDVQRFCTESVALAQYFNDKEKHKLLRATCLDMGGGTSDISIWEKRKIVYQCSVLFAGRNIFSQFLAMNPEFTKKLIGQNWSSAKETSLMTKIDVWLRHFAEGWLKKDRIYKNDDEYFQRLITLTAIGTAGIYYYVGLILKVLHQEGKYSNPEITPVYIGGNGSRFLHWLSTTGKYDQNTDFNKLLSLMLSKGSGFEDTKEKTRLSKNPKHEVACGLVLNQAELTGITENTDQHPIAGESYYVEYNEEDEDFKENQEWQSRLHLKGTVGKFEITELTHLQRFLYEFHAGIQSLNIQSVKPLAKSDYKLQKPQNKDSETESEDNSNDSSNFDDLFKPKPPSTKNEGGSEQLSNDKQKNDKQKEDKNRQLWREVRSHLDDELLNIEGKNANDIREVTPFIMGLKSLLFVLGTRWAESYKD